MRRLLCSVALVALGAGLAAVPGAAADGDTDDRAITWFISNRLGPGAADYSVRFGPDGADGYLAGDWNGDGTDDLAVRDGRAYHQFDLTSGTTRDVSYGRPDDEVFVADWNGDGRDTLAVRRGNVFHVSTTGGSGNAGFVFGYGRAGDEVFVGDWDGDGTDTLAVRRGNVFFVRNSLGSGNADVVFGYGRASDVILVGDWNGDGTDTFAVRRGNTYHVRNDLRSGPATAVFGYGRAGDDVSVGDWDGDGLDTLAVRRPSVDDPDHVLLPGHRIVAHYGSSASPLLGVLGENAPVAAAQQVLARAAQWDGLGLPTVPAAEFIATIANATPGPRGDYSVRVPHTDIRPYIQAMRAVGGITVLDLQPGRGDFLSQAREYEALLVEPDVHLALDPEWRMGPNEVPAQTIGSVDAAEVNEVAAWLDDLVESHDLPPKIMVLHQFTPDMVTNRDHIVVRDNVTVVIHLDGFGSPEAKLSKVELLRPSPPFLLGLKLFLDEDTRLMSPAEVIERVTPDPVYVSYQ